MDYQIGNPGRIIVARLHENDPVYESIRTICSTGSVESAVFWIIGGVKNVEVVTGPEDFMARPIRSISEKLDGVHEILGVGTVFPDASGEPTIHMHASLGHDSHTVTGCPRIQLDCWLINELIIQEINGVEASRIKDESGFTLLTVGKLS